MAASESVVGLKVGMYPYIPDLNRDNLKSLQEMIKNDFEKENPDVQLTIVTNWDPYDVDNVAGNLSSASDSFDILEIDTIVLGEVVDKGVVHPIDFSKLDLDGVFFPAAVDGVTYRGKQYAVPTLNCGNVLMELVSGDVPPSQSDLLCSLEKGVHSEQDLKKIVRRCHEDFKGVSKLVGNFRGKWDLPLMFVDAYVDTYGRDEVDEAVDAPIDSAKSRKVLKNMKWFMDLDDAPDGSNKGEDGDYKDGPPVNDIADSDNIMMYGYSEWLSQVMASKMTQKKHIHASCIIAPPLGKSNFLLTFTDALIVNNSRFGEKKKSLAISKFIKYYSSLSFRNKYAEGQDLKEPHPPRYVLIPRKDFYSKGGFGYTNKHYMQLQKILAELAVAAPNHGIAGRHEKMNEMLVDKLHLPPTPPPSP